MKQMTPINPFTGLTALGFTQRGPLGFAFRGAPNDGGGGGGGTPPAPTPPAPTPPAPTPPAPPAPPPPAPNPADEAKPYTQAQLDAMFEDRVARDRKARGIENFDTYKQSHEELQQLKDKDLPEIDRLRNQLAEKETAAATATQSAEKDRIVALQYQVAAAKEVPFSLAERLRGSTKEEIEADADKFLAETGAVAANGGRRRPDPNGQQGTSSTGSEKSVSAGAELFAAKHKKTTTTQQ